MHYLRRSGDCAVSAFEIIWSLGLLGALFAVLTAFKRIRRRTVDFRETAEFKERLPAWVKQFEAIALCVLFGGGSVGVAWLFYRVIGVGPRATVGAGGLYFAVGACLISIPMSALAANLLSWMLPPVRAANQKAMAGSRISFWSMNRGLLGFGAISVPLGMVILALAAWTPWIR
jgi:hypothetical protein